MFFIYVKILKERVLNEWWERAVGFRFLEPGRLVRVKLKRSNNNAYHAATAGSFSGSIFTCPLSTMNPRKATELT